MSTIREDSPKSYRLGGNPAAAVTGDERGLVLVIVMVLIVTLALLGLAANRNIVTDIGIATNHAGATQAFYAAEAAIEYRYVQLAGGIIPTSYADSLPALAGYDRTETPPDPQGGKVMRTETGGDYKGLNAWVQKYRITASAKETGTNARSTVALDVEKKLIPVFQFLIFYQGDLELNPGSGATIGTKNLTDPNGRGWIHTNSNFYTSPGATETIYAKITTVGEIHDHRKTGDTQSNGTGTVKIMTGETGEHYQNLTSGSDESGWTTEQAGWKGSVKTGHEGIKNLPLELATGAASNPIDVLGESGGETMGSKAAVFIRDGVATDRNGNVLSTTYVEGGVTKDSVTQSSLYDFREGKTADTWNVDVGKFQQTQAGQYLASTTPSAGGESGVLYVKSSATDTGSRFSAVRLKNGASLSTPLTVATEHPVYVQGDYNTNSPKPAAILSDATTVLSNQWRDYSSSTGLSSRDVTGSLTVNADIMTGNRDTFITSGQGYGGGVHNLTRFLEDWSGQNFNFGGSLVCMWESQKVQGRYKNPGTYYNVPGRQFNPYPFGNTMPPGTPTVIRTARGTWRTY